jgi:hypothetical protein
MGDKRAGKAEGFDWEGAEDLTALPSEEELRGRLEALTEEERVLSYRREILRGRIDLIRAELVRRGAHEDLAPEDLARILLGEVGPPS